MLSLRTAYSYGYLRASLTGVALIILFNAILAAWVLSVGFYAINIIS